MNDNRPDPLDAMLDWYRTRFTHQMVSGSNISPGIMARNLACVEDAVSSYRQYLEYEVPLEAKRAAERKAAKA